MTASPRQLFDARPAFWIALLGNAIWINASEIWRYFYVVRPLLHDTFPGEAHIGAMSPAIFAVWTVWDTILILAATGFYWLFLSARGNTLANAVLGASAFTITVFGLLWLGVVNMGLVPANFISAALPFAWIEQIVAALIVRFALRRWP